MASKSSFTNKFGLMTASRSTLRFFTREINTQSRMFKEKHLKSAAHKFGLINHVVKILWL